VPENVSGISPGTVPHVKSGQKVHAGPLGSQQSPIYIEVMQTAMRMSGAIWAMTEGMVTGDWSNGTYASMLSAEGPFMKGRQADQALTEKPYEKLVWLVLRVAWQQGQFNGVAGSWEQVEDQLDVSVQAPYVAARNDLEQTQVLQAEYENGVIPMSEWRAKRGYDSDEMAEKITQERGADVPPDNLPMRPTAMIQQQPPRKTEQQPPREDANASQSRTLGRNMQRRAGLESVTGDIYP
jgi:hypothetical protein